MSYADFMNKVRHWDNYIAKWMMRHFYILFFQMVLVAIFVLWFINVFNVINISFHADELNLTDKILNAQSVNLCIAVFLLLLNSFWILFMFSSLQRLVNLIKELNYQLVRYRTREKQ